MQMQSEAPSSEGPWPTVDYQAYALAKSGIFLKSGYQKSTRRKSQHTLINPRKKVLQQSLQLECQKLFVDAAGNTNYVRADPDVIFGAVCELCRRHGVNVASYNQVLEWIQSVMPGESYSQVLSLSEFTMALRTLCPDVFEGDGVTNLPPIQAQSKDLNTQLSYGLLRRKYNATALCDGNSKVETRRDGQSVNNTMVMIADSDHLCEAMKRDGRSARKFERKPGAYADKLEKDRINDIMRSGPGRDNTVRIQRSKSAQQKARHKYTSGMSGSLGCNLSMVTRHMNMEAHAKKHIEEQKTIQSYVNSRKSKGEAVKKFNQAALKDARDLKSSSRRSMMDDLKKSASLKRESIDALSSQVRSTRDVLHWSAHKSGIIPKDPVLAERKLNAASYEEWRVAADEDAMREGSIRDERLALLVQSKVRNGTMRSPISQQSLDANDVFMRAFTTDEDNYGFTESLSNGVFLDLADGVIAETKLPANMLAAARVYGQYPEVKPPAFMSNTIKGPKQIGYTGPMV